MTASDRGNATQVGITVETERALPPISADAGRIKQILLNLLDNAIKFSPVGGTVTLNVRAAEQEFVEFVISDNGPGMTAEEILIARQPFRQVDNRLARSHEGTGLGLPLAERLAEVHGGSLRIESEKRHGTRVIVRLPQALGFDMVSPQLEEVVDTGLMKVNTELTTRRLS